MAETAITAVLSKLGELAVSEAKILRQVGDDIMLLRDQLEWLQAFVRDADRRRRAGTVDGLTRVWAHQTRDVAFEAEDALDDYFYEVVGPKDQGCRRRWKALRRYITGLFTKVVVRHGLASRIKMIKSRLDHISENQKEYNIVYTPSVVLASSTTAIAAWRDDLENAVGFDQDVNILKKMLLPRYDSYENTLPDTRSISTGVEIIPELITERDEGKNKQPMHATTVGESSAGKSKHPMFISIVGESGAGKNTLAKIICRQMRSEMEVLVWYHMEPGCSTADLLTDLWRRASLHFADHELEEEEIISLDIGDKLRRLLCRKSFLLILGGISSKQILNSVRASLPGPENNDNGSRVILILDTENEEVAWHANTMNRDGFNGVHVLTRLDQARTRQLFFWKVLRKGQYEKESSMSGNPKDEEYSRLVHDITGGYPMAIVLLAGLLRFKEKPVQWDAVLQQLKSSGNRTTSQEARLQDSSHLMGAVPPSNECKLAEWQEMTMNPARQTNQLYCTRRAIETIFWASFEDLPNDLKSCLLYFPSYPKNFHHYADEVVRMWIAEGFIKPQKGKTMEELGHDCLKELVLRCLVEVELMKPSGGIELVRVHKSLIGFLQLEVRESGFMQFHDLNDIVVPPSVRRLSVQTEDSKPYTRTFANKNFPKLRSFICHMAAKTILIDKMGCYIQPNPVHLERHGGPHGLMFLRRSTFIRVISIQGFRLQMLPDEIGDMINLRYIRVDSMFLIRLPSSIVRLHNLQTLDIRNTAVEKVEDHFWKIKTLRHVLATRLRLPRTMSAIAEEDGGSELQTLHGVKPAAWEEWSAGNCPLDKMTNLQSLEMHGFIYERQGGPAFKAALGNMHRLGHLNVQGDKIPSCVFTDPSLRSLQTMVLRGHVSWPDVLEELPAPLRMVRPNLVQLKMYAHDVTGMPQSIEEQLEGILIQEEEKDDMSSNSRSEHFPEISPRRTQP